MPVDRDLLEAALIGYESQKEELDEAIAEIRRELGGKPAATRTQTKGDASTPVKRRTMSAAARKRIAAAQRKRWAEFHAKKSEG